MLFNFFSFFVSVVLGQNYILVPKRTVDVQEVSLTFGVDHLATIDTLHFFTSSHENVLKYSQNYLSQHFHIEEDQILSINNFETNLNEDQILSNFTNPNFVVLNSNSVPWHLDRIVQRELPLDNTFPYQSHGSCHTNSDLSIDTYIVDTGIDITHPEFEGRATWGANFADSKDTDCNNHGTHVSGLVGSLSYGVCTDANLIAVKVLDCNGSGSTSSVIKGIEWAFNSHLQKSKKDTGGKTVKSIINMSLGGGYSRALNKALETTVRNNNFYVVVAAGNENEDACNASPASSKSILTVMASDIDDNRAWFSNWGKCANIYAPGVNVLSTIPNNQVASYSGTSMASPLTAGVLNHYIDMFPSYNMKQIMEAISKYSSHNVIQGGFKPSTVSNLIYLSRSEFS
jgi:cerevisin